MEGKKQAHKPKESVIDVVEERENERKVRGVKGKCYIVRACIKGDSLRESEEEVKECDEKVNERDEKVTRMGI